MSYESVLQIEGLSKDYFIYANPRERLLHLLFSRLGTPQIFHALQAVSFDLKSGESLGIIGQNGAGKSTLLQLICGTVTPTQGTVKVRGRIAPLLELGAGFNLDFTGRENIYMNAAILGLSDAQIRERIDGIIEFADIGSHIDQPVRYYSSGMYVRLAFAVATSIDPQILVIDEAISVGDGEFARKSFMRIHELRERGATLLFCSHALYQVEALCEKALWLHQGQVQAFGDAASVVTQYREWLDQRAVGSPKQAADVTIVSSEQRQILGTARILEIAVSTEDQDGRNLTLQHMNGALKIDIAFASDAALPTPSLFVIIHGANGADITSAGTLTDGVKLTRNAAGEGHASLLFEPIHFLKGTFYVSVYLMCENGIHVYEAQERHTCLTVTQDHLLLGFVSLPHRWVN